MNIAEILQYLFPNASPANDYRVEDDGTGQRIVKWDLEFEQPSDSKLKALEEEAHLYFSRVQYRKNRVTGTLKTPEKYSQSGEQKDWLWHDINDGLFGEKAKSGRFYLNNKKIKDSHSKEGAPC